MGSRDDRARRRRRQPPPWANFDDDALLDLRFDQLGVTVEGTWVEACVRQVERELEQRDLRFRPHVWASTEWFSPLGVPGIAVPFYLLHPRLIRLERSQMLEVEGGTREDCLRHVRHECGHAIQHAFRLHARRRWQRVFGHSTRPYPTVYRPLPASRHYVQHLRLYYAQSHPDEDFAETFAVWLKPRSRWRVRYRGWPALRKLEVVDQLMKELAGERPPVRTRRVEDPLHAVRKTLREHYAARRAQAEMSRPGVYDRDLRALFPETDRKAGVRASTFLRRNRVEIRRRVSRWTGEYQYTLEQVLEDMIQRCDHLKLRASGDEEALRMDFAVLLTVQTMHFHYGPRQWISM